MGVQIETSYLVRILHCNLYSNNQARSVTAVGIHDRKFLLLCWSAGNGGSIDVFFQLLYGQTSHSSMCHSLVEIIIVVLCTTGSTAMLASHTWPWLYFMCSYCFHFTTARMHAVHPETHLSLVLAWRWSYSEISKNSTWSLGTTTGRTREVRRHSRCFYIQFNTKQRTGKMVTPDS